jgi:hypothetical protein
VLVVAVVLISVFNGRTGSSDPHTAVDRFWGALVQHDQKKAEKYVCGNKKLTKSATFTQLVDELVGYDIGPESGTGGKRVFPVTLRGNVNGLLRESIVDTTATRSAGKWYVCDLTPH